MLQTSRQGGLIAMLSQDNNLLVTPCGFPYCLIA